MDDIELTGAAPDLAQHGKRAAKMIADPRKPQALRRTNDEFCRGI
jgi:hypothetical protein